MAPGEGQPQSQPLQPDQEARAASGAMGELWHQARGGVGRAAVHGSEFIGGAGVLQVALGHTAPLGRAKPGEAEAEAGAEAEGEGEGELRG